VLRYERAHVGCRQPGLVRVAFDQDYKVFIDECRTRHGLTQRRVAEILEIPIDTLKNFSRTTPDSPTGSETMPQALPQEVILLVNEYLRRERGTKSVKAFCRRHPELLAKLGMNYREVLSWLGRLGFVSHRGIFLKNSGLDRILRFKPNQLWHGDGKNIDVIFNGKLFRSLWQCLADGKTTAIVGGIIGREENTKNLKDSLQDAEQKTGIVPMGIVLDNRLSENLPAIAPYLKERGIEIIKTFPGNPKSNSIIEENFNIFDRYVGKIVINGTTPVEIARSITQTIVEIFTQMKNRKPRRSYSYKNLTEVMEEADPGTPEEQAQARLQIKILADRLKNEQAQPIVSAEKKTAINLAIQKTTPPSPDVFENVLQNSRFTPDLILGSLAILEQKRQEHPEKNYGHTYFGGILRKRADQQAVEHLYADLEDVYSYHWDTMGKLKQGDLAQSLRSHPEATCTRLATDFMNMPVPAFSNLILRDLKNSFLVASKGSEELAAQLRKTIASIVVQSPKVGKDRRENLLCKLFEWENFIRRATPPPDPWTEAPVGNA
jgi:transposase InsO family protein